MDQELYNLANDPSTSPEVLRDLAWKHPELQSVIAANPTAYEGLLHWLNENGNEATRKVIAERFGQSSESSTQDEHTPDTATETDPTHTAVAPTETYSSQDNAPQSPQGGAQAYETNATQEYVAQNGATPYPQNDATQAYYPQQNPYYGTYPQQDQTVAGGLAYTQVVPQYDPSYTQTPQPQAPYQQQGSYAPAYGQQPISQYYATPQENEPEEPEEKNNSKRTLIRIIIVAVTIALIAIAGLLAYKYFFSSNDATPDKTTITQKDASKKKPSEEPTKEPTKEASPTEEPAPSPSISAPPTPTESILYPAPAGTASAPSFTTPTGNISCSLANNAVYCRANETNTQKIGLSCPGTSSLGLGVVDGLTQYTCDQAVGGGSALPYGGSVQNGNVACTSYYTGVTCWSQTTGESFAISRNGSIFGTGGALSEDSFPWKR
ncbi:variant leucine-rich repeat-containing protein [Actinotignum urinale]|uniref:variant leucine-rich repeat-containing protein n=1 Tax=Actinotignum urinale TaxID=190146 RepID=UPI0003B60D81|nr:hypothetical protein [Actinotignum urinale]MDY5160437.1 hypothetical protein [Actinotignum urinale]